jgi:hypothetical protein
MWSRTKRLINSYLDNLLERVTGPDRDIRNITRAEIGRLNELEVQARASAKVMEKELAEVELKIIGAAEREKLARERGDSPAASSAADALITLTKHRDLLKQQISEAASSAERARVLREQRKVEGEELAVETRLTSMKEALAGVQTPFDKDDPSATIDEMRTRLGTGKPGIQAEVAEFERSLDLERARKAADELLAQYKQKSTEGVAEAPKAAAQEQKSAEVQTSEPQQSDQQSNDAPKPGKTLGRTDGPIRPID